MLQQGVRRFLRGLHHRRLRGAAERVVAFLRTLHRSHRVHSAFQSLVHSIEVIKVRAVNLSSCACAPSLCV
jgi:hypothetical protein